MRSLVLLSSLVVASTALAGVHGDGVIRAEQRTVSAFDELELSGGLEVTVRRADAPSVRIETDENLLPLIRTEQVGRRLIVGQASNASLTPTRGIKVTVAVPVLKAVEASGGVDLDLQAPTDKAFTLDTSGGVELVAKSIAAERLTVKASGGVQLELGGRAAQVAWEASGGVTVRAKALAADAVTVDASGGCELELAARQSITGEASGGVQLTVHGDPPKSRVRTSGGADVHYAD